MLENILIVKKDVKNITLKVKPTGEVVLTTPKAVSDEYTEYIIKKRAKWIEQKKEFFASFQTNQKEYVSGEEFRYLGKSYRLKVISSKDENVKLQRGYLEIRTKNKNDLNKKQNLLYEWYYEKALLHFFSILQEWNKIVKRDIKDIKIRQMKTRWGSCNPYKSYINLNIELIKKPKICIEYVIFHELTHLIYPDHSSKFYEYLSLYMSDWEKRKEILEQSNL
ncbi:M48 family metallopeptidase [Campylobacter fetus]|uniref:M48 family metallopeptidase n=3 Tax=Campylobacter fetus TaxID=196 RepID=A0A5L4VUC1_CAMFE|nr:MULTISPECIES: SprT family zinc-dependent metalloprotease [Campylobacter]OCS23235.1 zinc metalloprotease [Campylobacter fetus subsp. venerealis cfvi97/532]OCS26770.1 zinc metalloprotease [Campylobacter fetus subsp. venerealis cfvB10]OCS30601.1 zinc metalloprotease [Campylobacter fetus subsp. venerealis LMG 6570 = CCUG 33900]OCS40068.1 zinc metalloprotease [Campylobacter fetus subsp. venerealis cfvi02/298]ABK83296.1 zinc metalloprotease [Campylobacter fetus subsp. fetus 82-40]